ncbi:porin family protein [Flavivirga sp. 57AJ16]|uniref:porin family protein n=1 Tax=Flavivirga sp. 57AJ16 TaxID=3025307 RepID=UPI0023658C3C|nr:porin family protein [Flavivirga sp. 57AJ16]MDD7888297.1 porin family protein [Flavivirga sp. 57AJ16]
MKQLFISIFFLAGFVCCFAQETNDKAIDSLYKEDQFYAGITYNLLGKMPTDVSQSGFSLGFHLGFIKDMPINKNRNVAIGLGLGYSANSFNQNLLINKDNTGSIIYSVLDSNTFTKNKFSSHLIELPIEFRWRTSTATDYNFWRIYTGFKLGYVFAHTTKYRGELGKIRYGNIKDFNNFQYGLTLSAGYNTWNVFLYYALNPIFSSDASLNGNKMDMNAVKVGLMFYIL